MEYTLTEDHEKKKKKRNDRKMTNILDQERTQKKRLKKK